MNLSEGIDKKITTPHKAALIAAFMAAILSVSKFIIGVSSGSMAVISSSVDSLLDAFISGMNFYAIKKASEPADSLHHYGHGKIENFSALAESLIIIGAGLTVIYYAIINFLKKTQIKYTVLDVMIMIISLVFSVIITIILKEKSKKTGSVALSADALHYASDVYTHSGGLLAIILAYFTGYFYFDYAFAVIIGIIIIFSSLKIFLENISVLMDKSIPKELEEDVKRIIERLPFPYAGFHKLRTRSSGSMKYIDLHLLICRNSSIEEAHEISENLEEILKKHTPQIDAVVHLEPCNKDCDMTEHTCSIKKQDGLKDRA